MHALSILPTTFSSQPLYPPAILGVDTVYGYTRIMLARIHNLANHVDLQTVTSEKAFLVFLAAIKS